MALYDSHFGGWYSKNEWKRLCPCGMAEKCAIWRLAKCISLQLLHFERFDSMAWCAPELAWRLRPGMPFAGAAEIMPRMSPIMVFRELKARL